MEKPRHIAIIMDGNGRWAKRRMLTRNLGHKAGADALHKLIVEMDKKEYEILTVYAFSTENWNRPKKEVDGLMDLLREYIKRFIDDAKDNNLKLNVLGDMSKLDDDIVEDILYMKDITKNKTGLLVNMAINYGGRDDILRMTKKLLEKQEKGEISSSDITEDFINKNLDTKGLPDPDLLIRTSGEVRLSNFLIWQLAYTEFYFTDIYWPDFTIKELEKAVHVYNQRQRRFGRVDS